MYLMVVPSKDRAERAARFAKTKEVEAAKAAALLARQAEAEVRGSLLLETEGTSCFINVTQK